MLKYDQGFYMISDSDMAKAEIDGEFAVIVLKKKLFFWKRKKRYKMKLVTENGSFKKIKIWAPYDFIVKLFIMLGYEPMICDERSIENKFGFCYKYIYNEEWCNPHYKGDYEEQCEALLAEESDLPF